jgi:DNA-binding response OmpR family regulator
LVVSRDDLYQRLRGIRWDGMDRSMDLRVSRLRTKLEQCGGSAEWIKSVRGEGYLLISRPVSAGLV